MPRKHPLSKEEIEVGRRLREAREQRKCPRSYLAHIVGVQPSVIIRIELGLAPLRYTLAVQIVYATQLSPFWLATGIGEQKSIVGLPPIEELRAPKNATFLEVYSGFISPIFEKFSSGKGSIKKLVSMQSERALQRQFLFRCLDNWMMPIPTNKLTDFIRRIVAFVKDLQKEYPEDAWELVILRQFEDEIRQRLPSGVSDSGKYSLTHVNGSVNTPPVTDQWPLLKKRLQKATAGTGGKSRLAEFLGAKLASVSQWLTDSKNAREPGAETALQMLQWVEHQERK